VRPLASCTSDLVSFQAVQSLHERINILEAQLAYERKHAAPWPLNLAWPDLGYQLPPYAQNLHPVKQTATFTQHDSHDFDAIDARFMQSGSAANDPFQQGVYNITSSTVSSPVIHG
jgi:hypothetical protein